MLKQAHQSGEILINPLALNDVNKEPAEQATLVGCPFRRGGADDKAEVKVTIERPFKPPFMVGGGITEPRFNGAGLLYRALEIDVG